MPAVISLILLIIIVLISIITGVWLPTAAAVGFLFGFALQKGSFCGASIMSSAVLFKDFKGIKAVVAAVAVSMVGFALMSKLSWLTLNPKGLDLLPMAIGGYIFGIGTVLGGGCISGSLYKAGEGRLNSMLALLGIGLGTNMAKSGAPADFSNGLKLPTAGINISNSLDRLIGIDYGIWTIVIIAVTTAVLIFRNKRKTSESTKRNGIIAKILYEKWSIVTTGAAIGVIAWLAYLSSAAVGRNYPLGVTGGVMAVAAFLTGVQINIKWWLFIEVLAIILGSSVAAKLSGELKFRSADPATLIWAFFGGVIMGYGAVLAHGCFIGNIISGWPLLSIGSLLAGVFTILGNWTATYLYLRGN